MPERYDINGNPIGFFSVEDEGMRYVDPTIIQPAVVSANRNYWKAQKWARENVRDPRERTAPYVAAGLGATMAAPFALDLGAVAVANPYIRTALDVAGNIDGARNLVSGNGVQKTIRLANSGDTWGAVKSGIGDILDLSGAGDLVRTARKFNRANRTLHAFNAIEPFGYTKHYDRAKAWVKDIMEDAPVDIDNPSWYTKRFKDRVGSAIPSENKVGAAELGGRTRFDAWRLYNGLPQKYGMYIKSPDGTYAYNLQEAQRLVDDLKPDFFGRVGEYSNTIDTFTSAGGNLEYDNLYDFGRDLANPNLSYELREIKDTWDLHPFSRDYNEAQKIQDSAASNGVYENLNWGSKPNRWINKMLRNVELGQITGGRPFVMRTEIPHTIDFTLYPERTVSSIGFNGTKYNKMPQAVLDYQSGMNLQDVVKKHDLPMVDMAHISDLKTKASGGPMNSFWPGGALLPVYPEIVRNAATKKYLTDYVNYGRVYGYPTQPESVRHLKNFSWLGFLTSPYLERDEDDSPAEMARRALLAKYTGVKDGLRFNVDDYVEESPYRPSNSTDPDAKYYRLKDKGFGFSRRSMFDATAGRFKIDHGVDENGKKYVSYYDIWDLAPIGKKSGNEIPGTVPVELYDRFYEEEDPEYYYRVVPEERPNLREVTYVKLNSLMNDNKSGGLLSRLNKHYNGDRAKIIQAMQYARGGFKRNDVSDKDGSQYYDIVRQRRNSVFNALMRSGMSADDAARLTPMIVTQQTMEGGWVLNRKDNNYGGMKSAGKTIAFDSEDDFQDAYIKMLDSKWHNGRAVENSWRSARDLDDWARILNREDLGLATKEAWEKYNKGKQGSDFVYLYAPQWENNNKPYREHLKKTEDRTAAYLKMIEADEPLMSLSPRQEERVVRQMPIAPEQPAMPLGMFRTMIPTSVQQKMPATQSAPAQQQAPLLRSLIPTSVQKKMNRRTGGGLIERYGIDKVRAAMQKVKR